MTFVRDRHAEHYRDLALDCAEKLLGPTQAEQLDRLHLEHDNLRAACHWLAETGRAEDLARTCYAVPDGLATTANRSFECGRGVHPA